MTRKHHFSHVAQATAQLIFTALQTQGPMSRAALAKHTCVSRPTVSGAIERLQEAGLVRQTSRRTQGQGRAGIIFEVASDYGLVIAVAIDASQCQIMAKGLNNQILSQHHFLTQDLNSPAALLQTIENNVQSMIKTLDLPVKAMGVSLAAPVDPSTHNAVALPLLPFKMAGKLAPKAYFEQRLHCPVVVDNDVNWATLAESTYGAVKDERNFICVYLGQGIGAGIFLDGRLIRGGSGLAGELGYVPASDTLNLQDYVTLARQQCPNLRLPDGSWSPAVKQLCRVIASAAIVVNPDKLVLTGPLCEAPELFEALKTGVEDYLLRPLPILRSFMPSNAPVEGAAWGAYNLMLTHSHVLGSA